MDITKKIAAATIGLSLLASPAMVGGQTVADLQAQIAALLAQINALQAQLSGLQGGAAGACSFTQNLSVGVRGDDVKCLQNYLIGAGQSIPAGATGYFGSQTQAAVAAWQSANGVSPAAGYFGPISRAKYSSLVAAAPTTPTTPTTPTPGITTPGAEGSMVATLESTPTSVTMNVKSTGVSVAAVKVKASGSDVKVDRLDVNFDTRPWLYISGITVTDGTTSKTMSVTQANSTEVTVGSSYDVRVGDLSIIIPKDTEKVLTVKVDAVSGLPGSETTKNLVLTFNANAIRGTDGANIQQYAPTAALATRTFTVKTGDTASLAVSAHSDNPKVRPVIVKSATETTDVVLAVFNVKATGNAAILRTVKFSDSTASGTLDVVYLYEGSTKLGSTSSIETASSTITDIGLTIPKDTTKVLTLKATLKKASGNYIASGSSTLTEGSASSNVTVGAEAADFVAEDATSFAAATVTGSDVVPGATYFYTVAPTLSLASTAITGLTAPSGSLTPQEAEAKIRLNVTANGADVYIPKFSSTAASSGLVGSTSSDMLGSGSLAAENITSDAENAAGDSWVVRDGGTKYIEYTTNLTNAGMTTVALSSQVILSQFHWGTSAALGSGLNEWDSTFLTDYKTSAIALQPPL